MVGRELEREILERKRATGEAEFIAVYGRRRVGKTFLIREFFQDEICFELTGIHGGSLADQLREFAKALGKAGWTLIGPSFEEAWVSFGIRGLRNRARSSW